MHRLREHQSRAFKVCHYQSHLPFLYESIQNAIGSNGLGSPNLVPQLTEQRGVISALV
jgi:hypothetical protein